MIQNFDKSKEHKEFVQEIIKKLEDGVKGVYTSENYRDYLAFMSTFHNYSYGNQLLIWMQRPNATLVAGYKAWQKKNRQVQKGEKGIQILAPYKYTVPVEKDVPKLDKNGKPIIRNGKAVTEKKEVEEQRIRFVPVYVFDVSQTKGDPLPSILKVRELDGVVPEKQAILDALQCLTPYKISIEPLNDGSKGYCHFLDKKIVIKEGMSDLHTVKTAIHEVAHALLHAPEVRDDAVIKDNQVSRQWEVEAESIAFVVTNRFGLDTSDYSFGYIASWSANKKLDYLKESLDTIQNTAQKIISSVEQALEKYREEQSISNPEVSQTEPVLTASTQAAEEAPEILNPIPTYNVPDDIELPTVEIVNSEHTAFKSGQVYSLLTIDEKLAKLEKELFTQNEAAMSKGDDENYQPYYKIRFKLNYKLAGEQQTYEGRYYLGDGYKGITDHIENFALNELELNQLPKDKQQRFAWVAEELVPFLEKTKKVELLLRENKEKGLGNETSKKPSIKERATAAKSKSMKTAKEKESQTKETAKGNKRSVKSR